MSTSGVYSWTALKRLDELETAEELKANRENKPMQRRFFPEGKDSKGRSYQDFRWIRWQAILRRLRPTGQTGLTLLLSAISKQLGPAETNPRRPVEFAHNQNRLFS